MKKSLNIFENLREIFFLIIVTLLIFSTNSLSAQECDFKIDPRLKEGILKATKDYQTVMKNEKALTLISLLGELEKQYDHWTIPYWKALVYSGVSTKGSIKKAQVQLNLASIKMTSNPSSCISATLFALQSHIYEREAVLMRRREDLDAFINLFNKANENLNYAVKNDTQNPSVLVMASIRPLISTERASSQQYLTSLIALNQTEILLKNRPNKDINLLDSWNSSLINRWKSLINSQLQPSNNSPNLSEFRIKKATEGFKNFNWILLLSDKDMDGKNPASGDGKSLHYFYDETNQKIWFKFDLYDSINPNFPALSIAFDNDNDETNGISWYGTNKNFKVDGMLSVGVVQKRWNNNFIGYNGFTNAEGIKTRNWLNGQKGIVDIYISEKDKSYYLSVDKKYFGITDKIRLIGSVGSNALWNDDIGDDSVALIKLN